MKVHILTNTAKAAIRKDDELMLKIARANNIRVSSVDRWLNKDSVSLTTVTNLELIRNHFGWDMNEVLTEEVEKLEA